MPEKVVRPMVSVINMSRKAFKTGSVKHSIEVKNKKCWKKKSKRLDYYRRSNWKEDSNTPTHIGVVLLYLFNVTVILLLRLLFASSPTIACAYVCVHDDRLFIISSLLFFRQNRTIFLWHHCLFSSSSFVSV